MSCQIQCWCIHVNFPPMQMNMRWKWVMNNLKSFWNKTSLAVFFEAANLGRVFSFSHLACSNLTKSTRSPQPDDNDIIQTSSPGLFGEKWINMVLNWMDLGKIMCISAFLSRFCYLLLMWNTLQVKEPAILPWLLRFHLKDTLDKHAEEFPWKILRPFFFCTSFFQ